MPLRPLRFLRHCLLQYSTSHASTALFIPTAPVYNTDWCLSVAYVWCSYFLYNLDIDAYNSSMAISCPASWLHLYHLASTLLQLAPLFYMATPKVASPNDYSQASTLCVVGGFLLVKVCALAACSQCMHLKLCASSTSGSAQQSVMGRTKWPATYTWYSALGTQFLPCLYF